jgi:hypothetical protein
MKRAIFTSVLFLLVCRIAYSQPFMISQGIVRIPTPQFSQGPVISPDSRLIAYSAENFNGVFVHNRSDSSSVELCSHLGSGWGMRWMDSSRLLVRSTQDATDPRQRAMGLELIDVVSRKEVAVVPFALQNRIEVPQQTPSGKIVLRNHQTLSLLEPPLLSPKLRTPQRSERDWTFEGEKIISSAKSYSTPGNRELLSLVWSSDSVNALVELAGRPSLYLFTRTSGKFRLLAEKGERPSWGTRDSYVYMQTDDDGHAIIKGEIFIASVNSGKKQNLTEGFLGVALNPSIASDGTLVFNTPSGELFLMKVEIR